LGPQDGQALEIIFRFKHAVVVNDVYFEQTKLETAR